MPTAKWIIAASAFLSGMFLCQALTNRLSNPAFAKSVTYI
jgi:hypothetical protein